MRYLVPLFFLLALYGCDSNAPESQDISTATASPEQAAADEVTSREPAYVTEKSVQGMVNQRGLYRLVRSGGLRDDPNTSTGKAVSKPVIELVKSTGRIPLIKGAQIYLQYRIWYVPDQPAYVDLRRVLRHPEMKLPDGSVATGSDYTMKGSVSVNQIIGYTGYGLDEDYELVEGDWVFEVWYQDEKLIEQKFTTYWPDKEELAALEPMLALGNKVLSRIGKPQNPDPRFNWPRVIVGEKEMAESAPLSEMKQAIDDPMSQQPPR